MPTKENTTMRSDIALRSMTADTVTFGGEADVIKITLDKGVWHNLNDCDVLGFTFEPDPEWAVNGRIPIEAV